MVFMKKCDIHDAITEALLKRFKTAEFAASQAYQAATNKESVAENKYDTFGLEASYLAHGQSQRVIECEQDWLLFSKKALSQYQVGDAATLWCAVELTPVDSPTPSRKYFFISPCAGGLVVEVQEQAVYVITASSPVGKAIIGKTTEEEVHLSQNGVQVVYEITSIQ